MKCITHMRRVLYCVAVCCSAVCCSVLQRRSCMKCITHMIHFIHVRCSVLQCVAVQCVAFMYEVYHSYKTCVMFLTARENSKLKTQQVTNFVDAIASTSERKLPLC